MDDELDSLVFAMANSPAFEIYDPHADLLDLAIWSMYHWVVRANEALAAEQAAASAAATSPDSTVSTDSSRTDKSTIPAPDSTVSTDSTRTDKSTPPAPDSTVSTDSTRTDKSAHPAPDSTVSTDSTRTDKSTIPAGDGKLTRKKKRRSARDEQADLLAQYNDPAMQAYLNTLQYFFSASDIFALMHPEAVRRARLDLAERLTPARVGRLLSELGLQRDRTTQGRRFRLTFKTLAYLLNNYIYVFNPEGAKTTYNRRWDQ